MKLTLDVELALDSCLTRTIQPYIQVLFGEKGHYVDKIPTKEIQIFSERQLFTGSVVLCRPYLTLCVSQLFIFCVYYLCLSANYFNPKIKKLVFLKITIVIFLPACVPLHHSVLVSCFLSGVCRKAPCCASERNSPKTGSLSCRCWKDILTLFDFWCRLMTSGKQTPSPPLLTNLSSTLGWPLSLCDWQEILTYTKLTEHDKSPIMTSVWLCAHSTVQSI